MNREHWNSTTDGPLTEDNMKKKLEKKGYTTTIYTYPPGTYFSEHMHDVDKIDAVLSGQFKIGIHNTFVILTAGDSIDVPQGTPHTAEVIGDETVVSIDAIKN